MKRVENTKVDLDLISFLIFIVSGPEVLIQCTADSSVVSLFFRNYIEIV